MGESARKREWGWLGCVLRVGEECGVLNFKKKRAEGRKRAKWAGFAVFS